MDGLGLGYEELRKHNERLICGSTTGFGPTGEWSRRAAFDHIAQGMSGALIAQGGGPGKEPQAVQWGLADQSGSIVFAYGIMAAIVARERFGAGQRVDASLLGSMMTVREGAGGYNQAAFGWHQASDDKWLTVGVLDPKDWPGLCRAIGREDLISDERSADAFARREHADWLLAEAKGRCSPGRGSTGWTVCWRRVCPAAPCWSTRRSSPSRSSGRTATSSRSSTPSSTTTCPWACPSASARPPAPCRARRRKLGQHTEEVLLSPGYDWDEIERLHDERVTAAG